MAINSPTGGIDLGIDYRLTDHLAFGTDGAATRILGAICGRENIDVDSGPGRSLCHLFQPLLLSKRRDLRAATTATTQAGEDFKECQRQQ